MKQTMKRRWFNIETRPSRLFGDRDRDGVANVFDCQPRNPRRQDGNSKIISEKEINRLAKADRAKHVWEPQPVGRSREGKIVYSDGSEEI